MSTWAEPKRRPEQAVERLCKIVGECRVTAEPAAALRIVALCGYLSALLGIPTREAEDVAARNIMPEDRR